MDDRRRGEKRAGILPGFSRAGFLPLAALVLLFQACVLAHLAGMRVGMTFLNNPRIPGDPRAIVHSAMLGLGTTGLMLAAFACLLSFLPRRFGRAAWVGGISVLGVELAYRYARGVPFDPEVVRFNFDVLKYWSSWQVVGSVLGPRVALAALPLAALVVFRERLDLFALPESLDRRARIAVIAASVILTAAGSRSFAFADKWNCADGYLLLRSLPASRRETRWIDAAGLSRRLEQPYPLFKDAPAGRSASAASSPNVIVLFLESFPGEVMSRRLPDGKPITPFLDGLKQRSLYVRHFYSNSVQTAPAYTSTHCGLIPSMTKIQSDFAGDSLRCLPAILRDAGYETILYSSADPAQDNMKSFFETNGFDVIDPLQETRHDPGCTESVVMGLRDDCVYSSVLQDLERRAKAAGPSGRPFYASLLTTVTHYPFGFPDGFPKRIENPRSAAEDQINVAALGDRFLAGFMAKLDASPYLKNTIVVIVGDHSFPASRGDRNGVQSSNEIDLTVRHVAVPFFIDWPGRLRPRRIEAATYSQVDIAPTILDLLGLSAPNSFVGHSILKDDADNTAPIVQPYSGRLLGAIRYPFFYRIDERNSTEEVALLDDVDFSERPVDPGIVPPRTLAALKSEVQEIFLSGRLLKDDRIFPRRGEVPPEVSRR